MILNTENPKDFTKTLLELIDEFSKVAGYKINIQKSVAILYTNNELTKREIKKTNSFIASKNYLSINLTKKVNKTLKKEVEEDTNKWKHILCVLIGRINIIKISKVIYRFNSIPIMIPNVIKQ